MIDKGISRNSLRCGSLDEFAMVVGNLPVPWVLDAPSRRFKAQLNSCKMGELLLADVEFGPCRATRTRGTVEDSSHMCLTFQQEGLQSMSWADREIVLEPGEIILWDGSAPMQLENLADARAFNFWFPTRLAEQRVGPLKDRARIKASCAVGLPQLLQSHQKLLLGEAEAFTDDQRLRLFNIMIDLIALCFPENAIEPAATSRRDGLASAAKAYMLKQPDLDSLTPASVAAVIGASVRSLQLAFAGQGTTFSAFLLSIKLDRAKAALQSSDFASSSVTDIAHCFGFFDASHLSRTFRQKFGATPSEFRSRREMQ